MNPKSPKNPIPSHPKLPYISPNIDKTLTHFASQEILAKDWLTVEEDLAWKDL